MGLRIPKNQIVESKYTSGGEYMFASTQNEYKGYYYELNNKTFAGKEFNTNNPEIIKIQSDKYNTLLGSAATYIYGIVSKVKLNNSKPTSIPLLSNPERATPNSNTNIVTRYFVKKLNSTPIVIREIDQQSFEQTKINPIYQIVAIEFVPSPGWTNGIPKDIDKAEQQMPGIKAFLGL
jgi:hypothetical protein